MSPSRRRAIGAVRGLASRALCYGAAALPQMGVTGRRALREPGAPAGGRGRTETPPSKTLSVCTAITPAHYPGHEARVLTTQYSHAHYPGALPGRRDGDIAPYRHYTRGVRRHYAPAKFARALPVAARHPGRRTPHRHATRVVRRQYPWQNIRKKEPARNASSFCRGTARIVRRFRPFRRQPR